MPALRPPLLLGVVTVEQRLRVSPLCVRTCAKLLLMYMALRFMPRALRRHFIVRAHVVWRCGAVWCVCVCVTPSIPLIVAASGMLGPLKCGATCVVGLSIQSGLNLPHQCVHGKYLHTSQPMSTQPLSSWCNSWLMLCAGLAIWLRTVLCVLLCPTRLICVVAPCAQHACRYGSARHCAKQCSLPRPSCLLAVGP